MKIQTIFEAFEQFELGRDGMAELEGRLEAGLAKVDREDLPSKCKAVPGIDKILLQQLRATISP